MAKILRAESLSTCIGCFTCMMMCALYRRRNHSIRKSAIRINTSGGLMSGKFVSIICLACEDAACVDSCRTGAMTRRSGGGVKFDESKCMGCKHCANTCLAGAIYFDPESKTPIVCNHCGICVNFCPHGCLTLEEAGVE